MGDLEEYYAPLLSSGEPGRMSGWRHALDQAVRFEVALGVLTPWPQEPPRVLDLGCGTGELFAYLRASGRPARYVGVDLHGAAVARARQRHPAATFVHADMLAGGGPQGDFDLVVACGALVSGAPLRVGPARRGRLRALAAAMWRRTGRAAALVVLAQEIVTARLSLAADAALAGATAAELEALGAALAPHHRVRDGFLATDRALLLSRAPLPAATCLPDPVQAVLAGPLGAQASALDIAALWLETDRPAAAAALLTGADAPTGERARLLRSRLALLA